MSAIDDVYLRRARQLARRQATDVASATLAVLVFSIGSERYAIELSALTEVFPYRGCTAVPGAPPALLGVINVRGDIRAVADFRRLLGLPAGDDSAAGYVVMLRQRDCSIGLRIEAIDDICQIDATPRTPAGSDGASAPGSRFVKALAADTIILIDTNAVLSSLGLAVA